VKVLYGNIRWNIGRRILKIGKSIVRNVLVEMVVIGVFAAGCGAGGAKKAKKPKRAPSGLSVPEVSRDGCFDCGLGSHDERLLIYD